MKAEEEESNLDCGAVRSLILRERRMPEKRLGQRTRGEEEDPKIALGCGLDGRGPEKRGG